MSMRKLTKNELVALNVAQGAEIEQLRVEIAQLKASLELRPSSQPPRPVHEQRSWDEFADRKAAMAWAKEAPGRVLRTPRTTN